MACSLQIWAVTTKIETLGDPDGKELSIHVRQGTLKQIFEELSHLTGYSFSYGPEIIDGKTTYSVDYKDKSLSYVLRDLADRANFDFLIQDKLVLIKENRKSAGIQNQIQGVVLDEINAPLPGANVVEKGTSNGTTTDFDGKFVLVPQGPNPILVISYIGYMSKVVALDGETMLSITMEPDAQQLEDVVVVGYGTQKKSEVTSSISQIDGRDIKISNASNVAMSLQGRASGVELIGSGTPGATPNFRIRGVGTINNSEPLIVLDGVPVDNNIFAQLSAAEIQSVEILKDAASAAIYGTRAANGVVLVTTNRANFEQAVQVRLNASAGVNSVIKDLPVLNAGQLWDLKRERYLNDGNDVPSGSPWANEFYRENRTDWQDEVFHNGIYQDYNVSVSSGSKNATMNVDLFHRNEEGTVKETFLRRYGINLKSLQRISDKLSVEESIRFSKTKRGLTQEDGDYGTASHIYSIYMFHPSIPVRNEDGSLGSGLASTEFGDMWNPTYYANWKDLYDYNTLVTLKLDYKAFDGFTLTGRASYQKADANMLQFRDVTPNQSRSISAPFLLDHRSTQTTLVGEIFANYAQDFGLHNVGFTLGGSAQETTGSYLNIRGEGFASVDPDQRVIDNASTVFNDGANHFDSIGLASAFFRGTYNYNNTYFLSGIFRADASSRFADGNKWGYFPSMSAGWRISNEGFFGDESFISNLKLNGSWGQLGNQNITPFQYLSTYTKDTAYNYILGGTQYTGSHLASFANPDVTWETTTTLNILLEAGFFENKLGLNTAYYKRNTKDMFVPYPKTGNTGLVGEPYRNLGEVVNTGLEVEINYRDAVGDLYYSVGLNGTFQENELVRINGLTEYFDNGVSRTYEGQPLATFFGHQTNGIYQNQAEIDNDPNISADPRRGNIRPGDVRFVDTNGDNLINPEDRTAIGNPNPKFLLGLNLGANYRQWDFAATFSGAFGHELYDVIMNRNYSPNETENMYATAWERWTGEGTTNKWPRMTSVNSNDNYRISDLFLKNGDYLRLKDVNLGYSLPQTVTTNLGLTNFRMYLSGRNLLTFTSFDGVDPEENGRNGNLSRGQVLNNYPQSKTVVFGLEITF